MRRLRVAVANGVGLLKSSRNVCLCQPFRSFIGDTFLSLNLFNPTFWIHYMRICERLCVYCVYCVYLCIPVYSCKYTQVYTVYVSETWAVYLRILCILVV